MMKSWFKFNLLTLVGALLTLILGSSALSHYYQFLRLAAQTEAKIEQFKVVKKSSSSYPIRGYYLFDFQGKTYHGSSLLLPPYHLNRLSAETAITQLEKKKWVVWFDPKNPAISTLQKALPAKKIIYALIALGVTIYFWFVETASNTRNPMKRSHHLKP